MLAGAPTENDVCVLIIRTPRDLRAARMPTNPPVVLHSDGSLAVITVTAPPLNLLYQALIDGLTEAVQSVPPTHRGACCSGRKVVPSPVGWT
jgi:hypothetical protein